MLLPEAHEVRTEVRSILLPEAIYTLRHRREYEAIWTVVDRGEVPDPLTVAAELGPDFAAADLFGYSDPVPGRGAALGYARRIARAHLDRRRLALLAEARRAVDTGDESALSEAVAAIESLGGGPRAVRPTTLGAFLSEELPPVRWVIPDRLQAGERLIVTGESGHGKSTLLRQMAVQAAAGVHPDGTGRAEPVTALLVDVENPRRLLYEKLAELRQVAGRSVSLDERLFVEVRSDFDLLDPDSVGWLMDLCDQIRPELIVAGPVYKLATGDPNDEQTARQVAASLDRIRDRHQTAIILEAHTPHGHEERPYGASLWKRWPEFGIFLAPDGRLRHWRGPRSERPWPTRLLRDAGPWPWSITTDDPQPATWDGPTRCADAVLHLLTETGEELGVNAISDRLRAAGQSYRKQTVSAATELLANQGHITSRPGPRRSRLFTTGEPHDQPLT